MLSNAFDRKEVNQHAIILKFGKQDTDAIFTTNDDLKDSANLIHDTNRR